MGARVHNTGIEQHFFLYFYTKTTLTHLCCVDSSTTTLWTSLFPTAGCMVSFYYFYVLEKFLYLMQSV